MRDLDRQALAAARTVAAAQGLPAEQAEVISSGSNVLVHLEPSPVVARVMSGTVVLHEDPRRWLEHEVAVLRFLAPSGLAVAPSPLIDAGPYQSDGLWITFCELVEAPRSADLDEGAETLGRALHELHDELSGFSGELPDLRDLRDDIERLRRELRPTPALSAEKIESLRARLLALNETVFEASWPVQALHGDASLGNLFSLDGGRLVWNDFEDTFRGPVHWDLAGYVMSLEFRGADSAFVDAALDAYGGIERRELAPITAAHEVYDEIWRLYDGQRRGSPLSAAP